MQRLAAEFVSTCERGFVLWLLWKSCSRNAIWWAIFLWQANMELLVIAMMWIPLLISCLNHITPVRSTTKLQYSRKFLLQWHRPYYVRYKVDFIRSQNFLNDGGFMENASRNNDESKIWKPRKQGKKSGVHQRLRKQCLKRIPLTTIVIANVQSLRNKTDELQATVHVHHSYREACILAFTET